MIFKDVIDRRMLLKFLKHSVEIWEFYVKSIVWYFTLEKMAQNLQD